MQETQPTVKQFKQVLLWPVQLVKKNGVHESGTYWDMVRCENETSEWKEVPDEFMDNGSLSEASYQHFVSYAPFAQRFLYGEGYADSNKAEYQEEPVHIFYRNDIRNIEVQIDSNSKPILLVVPQCTLFFFYDVEIAILCLEVEGKDLPLDTVMDLQYYFGRSYPGYWDENGDAVKCPRRVSLLDKAGEVLAVSDYQDKKKFLKYTKDTRTVRDADHWRYLMHPLVQHYAPEPTENRYRKVGYRRIPVMSYIAVDDVWQLSRADMVRLGMLKPAGDSNQLPFSNHFLDGFEEKYCYDRYWDQGLKDDRLSTRFIFSEQGMVIIGSDNNKAFTDAHKGILNDFNSTFLMQFLIAHFQKASMLMTSDKLVHAICELDYNSNESVKQFENDIKEVKESFLRFTHRYWFKEVANQTLNKEVFYMMHEHNHSQELFEKTRMRIIDMQDYLEKEELQVQSNTVVRLTIVSMFGLISTITIGILDIDLLHIESASSQHKMAYFTMMFIFITIVMFYTVIKSKHLSYFIDDFANNKPKTRDQMKKLFSIVGL